jgi:hypothetical protein
MLLNPTRHNRYYPDHRSTEIMHKTIAFFEHKGKHKLKHDDHHQVWYADFPGIPKAGADLCCFFRRRLMGALTVVGTPGAIVNSTRSWLSTGWLIGIPGRYPY